MGTNDRQADKFSLGRGRFAGGRKKRRRKMKAAATGFYPSGFVNESCPPSLIKRLDHLGSPCLILILFWCSEDVFFYMHSYFFLENVVVLV